MHLLGFIIWQPQLDEPAIANTNTRMAETIEHWKRWISKEPLRLLSTISARCLVCIAAILPAAAQSTNPGQTPRRVIEQTLGSGGAGQKLTAMLLEHPPGAASPPHQHPAAVFVYVHDGEVISQLGGESSRVTYRSQSWFEAQKQGHLVSRNASPARLLVVFISNVGNGALTVPIPKVSAPTHP
jgi:quercetin dioxygenase-like cupin family protein